MDYLVLILNILLILARIGIYYYNHVFSIHRVQLMFNMFILRRSSYRHRKNFSPVIDLDVLGLNRGWHRVTLPLPMATLQQKYIRFRLSTPPSAIPTYSWAIDRGNE